MRNIREARLSGLLLINANALSFGKYDERYFRRYSVRYYEHYYENDKQAFLGQLDRSVGQHRIV
jgi:hypothetical protein